MDSDSDIEHTEEEMSEEEEQDSVEEEIEAEDRVSYLKYLKKVLSSMLFTF